MGSSEILSGCYSAVFFLDSGGIKCPNTSLENILQSHVDIVTLVALDWIPEESYEDSVGDNLVNLLVIPNAERFYDFNSVFCFKFQTCGI